MSLDKAFPITRTASFVIISCYQMGATWLRRGCQNPRYMPRAWLTSYNPVQPTLSCGRRQLRPGGLTPASVRPARVCAAGHGRRNSQTRGKAPLRADPLIANEAKRALSLFIG